MCVKKLYKCVLFCVILCAGEHLFSQTYIQENKNETETAILEAQLNGLNIFTSQPDFEAIDYNQVALKQIGDYNKVDIQVQTNFSDISVLQSGNSNKTTLDYLANTAIADLRQLGNNNEIRDYVTDPNLNISLELEQLGDGKLFERNGVNELTQSLKFIQTDATPFLIIRSFN